MSDEKISEDPQDSSRSDAAAEAAAFLDPEGSAKSEPEETHEAPELTAEALLGTLPVEEVPEPVAIPEPPAPVESDPEDAVPQPDDDEDEDDRDAVTLNTPPEDGIRRRWYAIHAHSGQEANVQKSLLHQAELEGLSDQIANVLVPMEVISEYKSGEKKVSRRKYFPGYLLLQLPEHPERNADLWHLIKETSGVSGFIGSRNEPVPLEDEEVVKLVEEMRGERERPKTKINFDMNERIKIIDGAFANFFGNIGEINEERGRLKVMIDIFERQTSVEVEFWQVEKL
jgi:transcription termination/antitermination protein NusG